MLFSVLDNVLTNLRALNILPLGFRDQLFDSVFHLSYQAQCFVQCNYYTCAGASAKRSPLQLFDPRNALSRNTMLASNIMYRLFHKKHLHNLSNGIFVLS